MTMPRISTSIYAECRRTAGKTQEEWAELLDISVESVKAYELRLRVPPHYTVLRMIAASGCEWLALRHLQETAECLEVVPQVPVCNLQGAAISLCNKIFDFADCHRDRQLLRIAEDGVIDETERPLFDEIVADLADLIGAAYQVRYAKDGHYDPSKKETAQRRTPLSGRY